MTIIGFALDITSQAIVTFCVGLVSGAGGFAGIKRYIDRPKVRMRVNSFDLIQTDNEEQRERIERVLREQGLATSVTEVEWKNVGRSSAKNLALEVVVPSGYIGYRMSPSDPQTLAAPWAVDERSTNDGHRIQIRQDLLVPNVHCTLLIERDRIEDGEEEEAEDEDDMHDTNVRFLVGDREIDETDLDTDPEN